MNTEVVKSWPRSKQKAALSIVFLHRVLDELCIVGLLHRVGGDGKQVSRQALLDDLAHTLESERTLINLLGKREAAKVYGAHEGVTSSMTTVNFVLAHDFVAHYQAQKEVD